VLNLKLAEAIAITSMLTVILTGAALIREREQGTVEHLLVMPVVPAEIMLSKIFANGLVVLAAAELSLLVVVRWWLEVPVPGSTLLFLAGACFYVFTVGALGILLGTVASTMGQFGLLAIPVLLVMMLLSGSTTPLESMPVWLRYLMEIIRARRRISSPSPKTCSIATPTCRSSGRRSWRFRRSAPSTSPLPSTASAASSSAAELRQDQAMKRYFSRRPSH
jgi:ABC-type multidrug transport system permease subunit